MCVCVCVCLSICLNVVRLAVAVVIIAFKIYICCFTQHCSKCSMILPRNRYHAYKRYKLTYLLLLLFRAFIFWLFFIHVFCLTSKVYVMVTALLSATGNRFKQSVTKQFDVFFVIVVVGIFDLQPTETI